MSSECFVVSTHIDFALISNLLAEFFHFSHEDKVNSCPIFGLVGILAVIIPFNFLSFQCGILPDFDDDLFNRDSFFTQSLQCRCKLLNLLRITVFLNARNNLRNANSNQVIQVCDLLSIKFRHII